MKEIKKFWSVITDGIEWEHKCKKQKAIQIWFSVSFLALLVCRESPLLAVIAVANFGFSAYSMAKNVPIEEE